MGALHEGHLSLVRAARASSDAVAASIFVNPTQFGPNEDLAKYPRSFERDCEMLEREGVSLLFAPSVEEMYPAGAVTWVTVEGLSEKLDGRSRPGHFRGVTTVVAKLFHAVEADAAFFGRKDAAQVAIVRRMVRDLNFAVEIVVCPIVREADGLAMSSRNAYLDPEQRKRALVLHRALMRVQNWSRLASTKWRSCWRRDARKLPRKIQCAWTTWRSSIRIHWTRSNMRPSGTLVAIAVYVGSTR